MVGQWPWGSRSHRLVRCSRADAHWLRVQRYERGGDPQGQRDVKRDDMCLAARATDWNN